jgi:hypothetical protein
MRAGLRVSLNRSQLAMSNASITAAGIPAVEPKRLAFFERYLTVWVLACMVVGVGFGKLLPGVTASLSKLEFGQGITGERAHRRPALVDDLPDDAESGLWRNRGDCDEAKGAGCDAVCELAGEAVQYGAAGVDIHAACFPFLD